MGPAYTPATANSMLWAARMPTPVAASHAFAASTSLRAQQGIDQAVIVIVGRTERQAARLKEVAASKLPCAERVVLTVIEIPHTAPAIRRAAE